MYLFNSNKISVRRMINSQEDKALLLELLSNPKLLELAYGEGAPWDMEKNESKFIKKTYENSDVIACFIEYENRAVGYNQYYKLDDNSYKFNTEVPYENFEGGYGVDLFIGYPEFWGKGIGTDVVKLMANYLMNTLGAKAVCADPEENNNRSVQCWKKAGFSPMGKIESYDESDKNCILMVVFK